MSWLDDAVVKTAEDQDAERKAALKSAIESQRKAAEATGVTINGVRYSGDKENRAALLEAVLSVKETSQTTFASWKGSNGTFRVEHPVTDVQQALAMIGQRRGALIALEGQYQAAVDAGEITDVQNLDWSV